MRISIAYVKTTPKFLEWIPKNENLQLLSKYRSLQNLDVP